ncbi:unnamed protein product [Dicrocoelium dendriticum]|nr:unnamed protein product [Dicrocoelium dendriticum]
MNSSRALFAAFLLLGIVPRKHADQGNGVIQPNCSEVHIRRKSGTVQSPGYPNWSRFEAFCNHEIGVRSKMQVLLNFTEVKLDTDFGRIVVFDGSDCLSKRIGLVLNGNTPVFISSGNRMTVLSLTDGSDAKWRFRAKYSTGKYIQSNILTGNCGKELTDSTGNFSYRGHGKVQVLCVWRITVSPGGIVHLGFNRLIMKSRGSRLRVLDGVTCGGTVLANLDKDQPIPQSGVNSTGNSMTVVYSSAVSHDLEIMDAFYSSSACSSSSFCVFERLLQ